MVLLDACSFVVDVQRRNDSVGDHPRAKRPRRASRHPAFKDQLNLFGTPDVEILPDAFLEEEPSADRTTIETQSESANSTELSRTSLAQDCRRPGISTVISRKALASEDRKRI